MFELKADSGDDIAWHINLTTNQIINQNYTIDNFLIFFRVEPHI